MTLASAPRVLLIVLASCAAQNQFAQPALAQPAGAAPAAPAKLAAPLNAPPAVKAVLELPRTQPKHWLDAISALLELNEPELAKSIADELAKQTFDAAAKAKLVEEVGTATLLRVQREPTLRETLAPFVEGCLAASAAVRTDPKRLERLAGELADPKLQRVALGRISQTGKAGVNFFVGRLTQEKDPEAQHRLREALVALAPESLPALIGALDSPSEALRTQAAYALGQIGGVGQTGGISTPPLLIGAALNSPAQSAEGQAAQWSIRQLTGEPIDNATADTVLTKAIEGYLTGELPYSPDADGKLAVWLVGPQGAQEVLLPKHEAALVLAARLARDRWKLRPDNTQHQSSALVLGLEAAAALRPTGATFQLAEGLGPELLPTYDASLALGQALRCGHLAAAVALCDELAKRHDPSALVATQGHFSSLAEALNAPSRSVRFAALRAVMEIAPTAPFAGSNRVTTALVDFASGGGEGVGVVAMPQQQNASTLAGYLAPLNLVGAPTNRGDRAIMLAAGADVEVVLIDLGVLLHDVRETLFQIRRGPGGDVPIALLADEGRLSDAQKIAAEHSRMIAVPRPQSAEALAGTVERLRAFTPGIDGTEVRRERATAAQKWLVRLLTDGPDLYELAGQAEPIAAALAQLPATEAAAALAVVRSPSAQIQLIDLASDGVLSVEERRAAVKALADNIERHGLLLESATLQLQYDRYNASATADKQTQEILGSVLDAMEGREPAGDRAPTLPPAPAAE